MMGMTGVVHLQAILAASNPPTEVTTAGHHPISCRADALWLDEDGSMGCEHGSVSPQSRRTRGCIDHSIAILLFQLLEEKETS
jgi:hypothetical protein